jgi:hypothetical protein
MMEGNFPMGSFGFHDTGRRWVGGIHIWFSPPPHSSETGARKNKKTKGEKKRKGEMVLTKSISQC